MTHVMEIDYFELKKFIFPFTEKENVYFYSNNFEDKFYNDVFYIFESVISFKALATTLFDPVFH